MSDVSKRLKREAKKRGMPLRVLAKAAAGDSDHRLHDDAVLWLKRKRGR